MRRRVRSRSIRSALRSNARGDCGVHRTTRRPGGTEHARRRSLARATAAGAGRTLNRLRVISVSSAPSMLRAVVKLPRVLLVFDHSCARAVAPPSGRPLSRGFGAEVRADDPSSPSIRARASRARPPETSQSPAEHECCGTLSVTVAFEADPTRTVRAARVRRRATRPTPRRSSAPRRSARFRRSPSARARSGVCARARQCQSCARVCRDQIARDTKG